MASTTSPQAAAAAAAAADNSIASPGTSPLVDVQDEMVLQRLTWIKFPVESRQLQKATAISSQKKKRDLYWPALHYKSHKEAADFGNHQNFQHMLAEPLLEMLMNDAPDPGPLCRLLGFQDGTYMNLTATANAAGAGATSSNNNKDDSGKVFEFVTNMYRLFIPNSKVGEYFDMSLPEEQELWDLYQAGVLEAKALLKDENSKKRRLVGNHASNSNNNKRLKPANDDDSSDKENNHNGGANNNNGGPDGDDKPDAAARVTFQGVQQEAPPVAQEAAVPVTATAAGDSTPTKKGKSSNKKKKKKQDAPTTPPFQARSDILKVNPDEPWKKIWYQMRCNGWLKRSAPNKAGESVWAKPGCNPLTGVPGVDYFTSEAAVQAYVQSKIPQWKPPTWDNPVPQPQPVVAAARVNVHVNRRAMSSSATVITVDSSPGAKPAPPVRSFRRRAASQVGAASKYTTQSSLVAYKVQERLWWRKTKVPSLSQVKPILHKLGIRRNESGSYVLPDTIGTNIHDDVPPPPDLTNAHMLRKYLCTKGLPSVSGKDLLITKQENDILHQWVSFAYVPTDDLEGDLTKIALPTQDKIQYLLSKFKFQKCDEKYFLPLVDNSGARGEDRVEGLHFFRGLEQVRDYIRRTASFAWTEDEFEESDSDIVDFQQDKALLRLWAASSPSPLPTYETSMSHIQKMESLLPRRDNEFETDSEAEDSMEEDSEAEDVSMACSADDSSEDESVEEEQSVEASSESEEESVQSGPSASDSDENSEGSSQASPPPLAGKRKTEPATKQGKKRSAKKQKSLPWWQTESFPSDDTMKPILGKLGIFKQGGAYVLPGKDEVKDLKSPESLRKFLCVHGIPVHSTAKPNLNDHEKELLRRWVSFAHVPVTQKQCLKELANILPQYEKNFASGSERQILPVLSMARFQKDANGNGHFPPGIDSLGRDRETRKANLKTDLSQVREYIRCSERLTLTGKDNIVVDDSELRIDADKLLALRLWGALEPSTLRSYTVDPSCVVSFPPDTQTAPSKVQKRKKTRKIQVPEPEPLDCPPWWTESSLEQIQEKIEELEAKEREVGSKLAGSRSRRKPQPVSDMTIAQLELASSMRMRIESVVRSSQTTKTPKTIDGLVADICGECMDLTEYRLKKFLCGDKDHLVSQILLDSTAAQLQEWIEDQEGVIKPSKSDKEAMTDISSPLPPTKNNAAERDSQQDSPLSRNDGSVMQQGSLVSNVEDASQPREDLPTTGFSSPLPTIKSTPTRNSSSARTHGAKKSLVSDLEDMSQSDEVALFNGPRLPKEGSSQKNETVDEGTGGKGDDFDLNVDMTKVQKPEIQNAQVRCEVGTARESVAASNSSPKDSSADRERQDGAHKVSVPQVEKATVVEGATTSMESMESPADKQSQNGAREVPVTQVEKTTVVEGATPSMESKESSSDKESQNGAREVPVPEDSVTEVENATVVVEGPNSRVDPPIIEESLMPPGVASEEKVDSGNDMGDNLEEPQLFTQAAESQEESSMACADSREHDWDSKADAKEAPDVLVESYINVNGSGLDGGFPQSFSPLRTRPRNDSLQLEDDQETFPSKTDSRRVTTETFPSLPLTQPGADEYQDDDESEEENFYF